MNPEELDEFSTHLKGRLQLMLQDIEGAVDTFTELDDWHPVGHLRLRLQYKRVLEYLSRYGIR